MFKLILQTTLLFLTANLTGQNLAPESSNTVEHKFFSLEYSEKHEQPRWVYYYIDRERLTGTAERKDIFLSDTLVKTGSASPAGYRGSGYDRGHMCPSAAVRSDQKGNDETFYMSNICPQDPLLNRGGWAELERWARGQAYGGGAHITCGPVLDTLIIKFLPSGVAVPGYYYMACYFPVTGEALAFIVPNRKVTDIYSCAVTVDQAEALTGIDFFPGLEDSLEAKAESSEPFPNKAGQKVQCRGIAKSTGRRCRSTTADISGLCKYHKP